MDGVVFARFSETLIGAPCIHAYGREQQFLESLHKSIDDMGGAYFLTFANQQWLSLRLDNIGNLLSFATGLLVVIARSRVDPSIGGLVLSFSLSAVGIIQMGIKYLVQVDNSMASTERLHQYATSTAQEAALESGADVIGPLWPEKGYVKYENVQMRYRPGLPLVIDGFSLDIRGGERLGVVGRTGAGKSTILSTLFRLTELSGGRILIDGVNIAEVGLQDLRSRLAIIPQDPTLFRGTVRSNLDPLDQHSDMELWNAMRQAHLGVGLDSAVEEEGLNFSLGQRQLLALARAVLRDARIVLIDEGTSSVDLETDALVQDTLEHQLHGKTLIAIAHRLRTVLLYDRVCVMDYGRIVELGPPLDLWEGGGIFRNMCDRSNITRNLFFPRS